MARVLGSVTSSQEFGTRLWLGHPSTFGSSAGLRSGDKWAGTSFNMGRRQNGQGPHLKHSPEDPKRGPKGPMKPHSLLGRWNYGIMEYME